MSTSRRMLILVPAALLAAALAGCAPKAAPSGQSPASQPASEPSSTASLAVPAPGDSAPSDAETSSAEGCYVELFDGDDLSTTDDHFRLTEPGEYTDLAALPGASQDWTDEADSLRVGPDATVTVWEKTGFAGISKTFEAGSEHPDLTVDVSSLTLDCVG